MCHNEGISIHVPQSLAKARALVSSREIKDWFDQPEGVLKVEAPAALKDKRRMFNGDEVGFPVHQTSKQVLAATGQRQVYQRTSDTKEQITVYACGNAAGEYMQPRSL